MAVAPSLSPSPPSTFANDPFYYCRVPKLGGVILIFNMLLDGQIKLSRIFDHNFDKRTDRLYEPLRGAVEGLQTAPSTATELQSKTGLA
jgi:hypothetical protein